MYIPYLEKNTEAGRFSVHRRNKKSDHASGLIKYYVIWHLDCWFTSFFSLINNIFAVSCVTFSAIFFLIIPTESFVTLQFPEKRTKCDGPIAASIALPPDQAEVESRIILKHPKLSSPKQRPSIKLVRHYLVS